MDAIADGTVSRKLYDYGAYHTPKFVYKRSEKRHTSVVMLFHRHTFGTPDLPGGTKKDQIYLVLEGLDQVDFETKDMIVP